MTSPKIDKFIQELNKIIERYQTVIAADKLLEEDVEHLKQLVQAAADQNKQDLKSLKIRKLFADMVRLADEDGWDVQRMLEESPSIDEEHERAGHQYYELSKYLLKLKKAYLSEDDTTK